MRFLIKPRGKQIWLVVFTVILLVLTVDAGISPHVRLFAEDNNHSIYPDKAGREAFRLWTERERDRSRAEAVRLYRDYWLCHSSNYYSAYRKWLDREETQMWMKDPDHNPLPPPPPVSPYPGIFGYAYPFQSYPYPPTVYGMPPWFSYPYPHEHHLKPHREKKWHKKQGD